ALARHHLAVDAGDLLHARLGDHAAGRDGDLTHALFRHHLAGRDGNLPLDAVGVLAADGVGHLPADLLGLIDRAADVLDRGAGAPHLLAAVGRRALVPAAVAANHLAGDANLLGDPLAALPRNLAHLGAGDADGLADFAARRLGDSAVAGLDDRLHAG